MKVSIAEMLKKIEKKQNNQNHRLGEYQSELSNARSRINNDYYPEAVGFIGWLRENHQDIWTAIENLEERMKTPLISGINTTPTYIAL